ncbi:MAG: transcriptional repressor [Candidatus Caenarcaniphilales bacterium]|nr:transcriptional repressor [Candidatus Caenarcaniphilales bacterium]
MTTKTKAKTETFLEKAIKKLKDNDFKQTKSRIDILNVLSEHDEALSPYQIQDLLKEKGKSYSAITIYRVLETFMNINIIHKVHSINGYMKCGHEHDHAHTLLVCKGCHNVIAIEREEKNTKKVKGFKVEQIVDEVVGLCDTCNEED